VLRGGRQERQAREDLPEPRPAATARSVQPKVPKLRQELVVRI
jgi:hypothetical protein